MMGLSQLSTEDLQALKAGDLSKVSTRGLMALRQPQEKKFDPTEDMSTGQRILAGIGQGMASAGRGFLQGISKLTSADTVGAELIKQRDIDEAARLDAPLKATKSGSLGSGLGLAAIAAPTAFIPGANTYMGAGLIGAGTGATLSEGDIGERAKSAALGGIGGVAGKALGDALAKGAGYVGDKLAAARVAAQAANAQKDAAAVAAQKAGYVIPPADVNPSMLNEALGGLSGKIKTAQAASVKNQQTTNSLARQALGISDDVPLNVDTLKAIRDQAGQAFENVRSVGTIKTDKPYIDAIDALGAQYQGASKSFPGLAKNDVEPLIEALRQPQFDSSSAVDALKVLRETADSAYRKGDTGLGRAAKSAAGELESMLERGAQQAGAPADLIQALRQGRQTIAKTYTVQGGLNQETGDVSAQALASALKKGKPLSGELETIAKTGMAFPKATQALKESPKAFSPLDFALSGSMGAATGNPAMLATLLARPAARSAQLSPLYQKLLAQPRNYAPGFIERSLPVLQSEAMRRALPYTGMLAGIDAAQ